MVQRGAAGREAAQPAVRSGRLLSRLRLWNRLQVCTPRARGPQLLAIIVRHVARRLQQHNEGKRSVGGLGVEGHGAGTGAPAGCGDAQARQHGASQLWQRAEAAPCLLHLDERKVGAVALHQLVVRALLHNVPPLHHCGGRQPGGAGAAGGAVGEACSSAASGAGLPAAGLQQQQPCNKGTPQRRERGSAWIPTVPMACTPAMLSAPITVDRRCATTTVVRPFISRSSASCTAAGGQAIQTNKLFHASLRKGTQWRIGPAALAQAGLAEQAAQQAHNCSARPANQTVASLPCPARLHDALALGVQRAGGLVQQQHLRGRGGTGVQGCMDGQQFAEAMAIERCCHPTGKPSRSCTALALGFFRMARAMAMRCFCPPLICTPFSPTCVSYLCRECTGGARRQALREGAWGCQGSSHTQAAGRSSRIRQRSSLAWPGSRPPPTPPHPLGRPEMKLWALEALAASIISSMLQPAAQRAQQAQRARERWSVEPWHSRRAALHSRRAAPHAGEPPWRRTRLAEPDVVGDGGGKQRGLLAHQAQLLAQEAQLRGGAGGRGGDEGQRLGLRASHRR